MKFTIFEVDKDYNFIVNQVTMDFPSLESAQDWCRYQSWGGYYYFLERITEGESYDEDEIEM